MRRMTFFCAIVLIGLGVGCNAPSRGRSEVVQEAPQAKVAPYPLDVCIVSDEKLDSMGKPIVKVYDGREVRFCCPGCVKKFEADKTRYLEKLDAKVHSGGS